MIGNFNKKASENLGMPMIYTLVCAIIEKINKDNEDRKTFEKDEKERLERQREEEELVSSRQHILL